MELLQLPDDVLVMVMQFVEIEDVFACRLVCKKLESLSLDRDVWRHRHLEETEERLHAVLHLAPCLDQVDVSVQNLPAFVRTKCAVTTLSLFEDHLWYEDDAHYPLYAQVIENQRALGRLRNVELIPDFDMAKPPLRADVLLKAIAACPDLKELTFDFWPVLTTHPVTVGPPHSSLTFFRFHPDRLHDNSVSFVNTVLAGHGATLEDVNILARGMFWREAPYRWPDTATARLLGAMSNLHTLKCDLMPGLGALAACKTLRKLNLGVNWAPDAAVKGAADCLRLATQITDICLDYRCADEWEPQVGEDLIDALASSGKSQVERLFLVGFLYIPTERPQPAIFTALPSLPALRTLGLNVNIDRVYEVYSADDEGEDPCVHTWLHSDKIKMALMDNPSLHVLLEGNACDACDSCFEFDCHQDIITNISYYEGLENVHICVFSHEIGKCPSPEHHSAGVWPWTEMTSDSL